MSDAGLPIDRLGLWMDSSKTSERGNDLMRPNWDLVDQLVDIANAGPTDEDDAELIGDILDESIAIDQKFAELRVAETVAAMRSWYVAAFGEGYEKELGWDRHGGR
ncbi:hypothetical protein [Prescottella equi]|uniref:hypothetical protein n=2 Tax=Rhodococcus hoagii TaxID=43767 RepID=UPI000AB46163|nr:hypothetical protein [Prescottella equi]